MRRLFCVFFFVLLASAVFAQNWNVSGEIIDKKTAKPIEYATVVLSNSEQWAVADDSGRFVIRNVRSGKNKVNVSCLGYVSYEREITINNDISLKIMLDEDNLALASAVVTAQENENSTATSRILDRTALDHVQLLNVADVTSLLPGGVTSNTNLVSAQRFNIRTGSDSEDGNATFGTAVEVDGVRLSSNASFQSAQGVVVNNIATGNIESIEVISGVPSVEYGDVGSGIVRISTKKGKAPYMVTFSTNPNTKQVSASKGFALGADAKGTSRGILNTSLEYTRAVGNNMSPYTSYDRKQLSLTWSNLFSRGVFYEMPLRISVGFSGNIGGMDSKKDPDALTGTWTKGRDNSFRSNFTMEWLLSKPWITNIEFSGSAVYGDKLEKTRSHYTSAAGTVSLHGKEEGYFVAEDYNGSANQPLVFIPRGYRYNIMCEDDKPFSYNLALKANWARHFGSVNNKVKAGLTWSGDKNFGIGTYSEDLSTAPSYRTYDFSAQPAMDNAAVYIEDNVLIPINDTRLNLVAGVRGDGTFVNGSKYGNVYSASPRFNARYMILQEGHRKDKAIRGLSLRAGWGITVKQPSFSVLYPVPSYVDINVLNPPSSSESAAYYGYYVLPRVTLWNSSLVWQKNHQAELGTDINIFGTRISVSAYYNRTLRSYIMKNSYQRFSYNYTDQQALESSAIPVDNRIYSIDRITGIVTVIDKTGAMAPQTIQGQKKESYVSESMADNSISPVSRYGVEWIIDFKKINPINTDIRIDGAFYSYRSVDKNVVSYSPLTQLMSGSNEPYRYVGYYLGGNSLSNGQESKRVNVNLTVTTHIPKVRMILSARFETSLMRYSRFLSEGDNGVQRSYAVEGNSYLPATDPSFMDRRVQAVTYPLYYSSYEEPDKLIPFYEKFVWAKDNDQDLYNDLSRLVSRSNYTFFYAKDYYSPYFSANFSVTKEIGDLASVSFYANNFFRNFGKVYSTRSGQFSAASSFIPSFYYGLTVRLKF